MRDPVIRTRTEILEAAGRCVTGGRDEEYGDEDNE